jgi:DNA-binding transcriptional MerR regulator
MTDEPLLTLRQVADELGLPESTVRYYRDAFLDHIPSVGTGRRRRYPPPAVAVLRSVARGYAAGRSREQILGTMEGVAPRSAGVDPQEKARRAPRQPAGISNLELLAAIVDGEREQRDALWQMAKEIVRLTDVLEGQEKVLTEIADHSGVTVAHRALDAGAQPPPRALGEGRAPDAAVAPPPPPPPPFVAPPPPPEPAVVPEPPAAWEPPPVSAPPVVSAPAPPPVAPWVESVPAGAAAPFAAPPFVEPPPAPPPVAAPPPEAAPPPVATAPLFGVEPAFPPLPPLFPEAPAGLTPVPEPPTLEVGPPPGAVAGATEGVSPSDMERLRAELESERQLVERLREAKVKLEHRVTDAESALEERRPRKRSSMLDRLLKPGEDE